MHRLHRLNRRRSLNRFIPHLLLFLAPLCPFADTGAADGDPSLGPKGAADLVFRNTVVYTAVENSSLSEAVAVRNGRIVFVGSNRGVAPWIGPGTVVHNLRGDMVLPGFHDSHLHPESGVDLLSCDLRNASTPEEAVEMVSLYAAEHPELPWVRGFGWELPLFLNANPGKELLDRAVPGRPAYMESADGHSAWVNSRALALAGVTAATPDPPAGRIERHLVTGQPSGTLREGATSLVSRHLPATSLQDRIEGLRKSLQMASRFGITSLLDAGGSNERLEAYARLEENGELTARVRVALGSDPSAGPDQVSGLEERRDACRSDRLSAGTVKIFLDGVIEAHTAALLEPYVGTEDRGEARWEADILNQTITALDAHGFQVHIHAIGDRAVRLGLDAFQAAREANGPADLRHQIAHVQLLHPDDMPRFRSLGVLPNIQALWAFPDEYITDLTVPVLGAGRSRWLYAFGSLFRSGAIVVGGSDWNVTSMNPLHAIQVGVTRRSLDAGPGDAWIPEETVGLDDMLAAYTRNGAYGLHLDSVAGTIEVGKSADLIILNQNLFEIDAGDIHRAVVLLTLLEGEPVYRHPAFAHSP